jgi:hypothetical protein
MVIGNRSVLSLVVVLIVALIVQVSGKQAINTTGMVIVKPMEVQQQQ